MTDATGHRPQLWVVAGPNGAGKTTLVTERLRGRMEIVNPDEIGVERAIGERGAGEAAIRRRRELLGLHASFAVETTLSGSSALRFMSLAKRAGYKITFVYVGLDSPELSESRVLSRVKDGGHDVPQDAILRRYPDSLSRLAEALQLADRAYIFDNSMKRRRLVLIRDQGRDRFIADRLPRWLTSNLPATSA